MAPYATSRNRARISVRVMIDEWFNEGRSPAGSSLDSRRAKQVPPIWDKAYGGCAKRYKLMPRYIRPTVQGDMESSL